MHRMFILISLLISYPLFGGNVITLPQAYQEILEINLSLKSANAQIYAKEGLRWQAGARPNPQLVANYNTIGDYECRDNNEVFIGVTQLIELGGKRCARKHVADAALTATEWAYEVEKKELYASLVHAFVNMAYAQERVDVARALQKVTEEMMLGIFEKTTSGKTSAIEGKKAEVIFKTANIVLSKRQAALLKAKRELAALWNCNPPSFEAVSFPLHQITPLPSLAMLTEALGNNPEIARVQAETAKACRVVSLERAQGVPDIAVQVGVTTEKFVEKPSLSFGIGIPIPIFDRNQGNISRASYDHVQALYDQMDAYCSMMAELNIVYDQWKAAYEQALELRDGVLPAAEESFQLAQEGYKAGKFDYLHLLDARSTLINVKEQYLDAIQEYHHQRAEAFRLVGACPAG